MRGLGAFLGVLIALAGIVFALQGIGVVPATFMHDSPTWVVIGSVMAVVGIALIVFGLRPKRGAPNM
jgi:hypothetical protein